MGSPEPPVDAAPSPELPVPSAPNAGGMGTVLVDGEQRVVLRAGDVEHKLGQVPAGKYVVYVDFGAGVKQSIAVQVEVDQVLTMKCNTLLSDCVLDD